MDYHLILTIAIAVVVALVVGALGHAWLAKRAPSALETKIQTDAFSFLTATIAGLSDTSSADKKIAAATQEKALQLAQLQHASATLAAALAALQGASGKSTS